MASVWNIVRAANYQSAAVNDENNVEPDKFKQKFTVNSLRMSLRKRIPLKRINVNGNASQYYDADTKKQKVDCNKNQGIRVETTMKKTFFRVAEQFTGASKKSQLKETPQKSTPRTRYRERMMSPPVTPSTPKNPFDSPCHITPIGRVEKLRKYNRTPLGKRKTGRTPRKTPLKGTKRTSDDFSRHLELVSCGIQHLESNSNKMAAAIERIGLDYEGSPLQSKLKSQNRLWKEERGRFSPISKGCGSATIANKNQNNTANLSNTKGMLRRTMTRMSLRVKNRPATLRSTKSASNIGSYCYHGPMASGQRKLAPLQKFSVPN